MTWIIDIIVVMIIALCTLLGYKKGLIKVAIKILAFFIAIIVSVMLYKPISNLIIEKTQIDDKIQNAIVNKVLPESEEENKEQSDKNLKGIIENNVQNTVNSISENFAVKIIQGSCLLIIYIVTRIILIFVSFLLTSIIEKIPVIKQFNKSGGIIYGFVKGVFLVWTIFALIYLISPLIQSNFIETINGSMVGSLLYNNNLLLNII